MDLICPKCQGAMRQYERNGITIDQCTECRGIFLDRGEMERLVEAENRWYGQQGGGHQPPPPPPPRQPRPEPYYEDRGYHGGHRGQYHYHKRKKKRSFMDDIFDF